MMFHLYFRKQNQTDYYIEGESKREEGYIENMHKKLINILTNEISVTFDDSKTGCKLNS